MMTTCRLCQSVKVTALLDFGMQPISNRFLADSSSEEYTHQMSFGVCGTCGILQIIDPVPAEQIAPLYDWINYNEPEGHLDKLAEIISGLSGLDKSSVFSGISFKDDSLLARLERSGFKNAWRIDPQNDLSIDDNRAGVETIQHRLTSDAVASMLRKHPRPDVLIARHILEHAHDLTGFLDVLKQLVHPEGYIVFEIPDCSRALEDYDYSCPWEEHIVYFTPETFQNCFAFNGLSLSSYECYGNQPENSLVAIVKPDKKITPPNLGGASLETEIERARSYADELSNRQTHLKKFLTDFRRDHGKIAVFGAGHVSCTFINLLKIKKLVEFVVDDNPHKQNMYMPGSCLPIKGSASLMEERIGLCLMSLGSDSEAKVVQNNQDFVERGGTFASIFPASEFALTLE